MKNLCLGFHTSHNAGVAALDESGDVLFAACEERYTKRKLQTGNPNSAYADLRRFLGAANEDFLHSGVVATPFLQNVARNLHLSVSSAVSRTSTSKSLNELARRFLRKVSRNEIRNYDRQGEVPFPLSHTDIVDHHDAHAYSAYYPSGFENTEILTLDGVGQCYSCTFSTVRDGTFKTRKRYYYNDVTIGADYEILTGILGFSPDRHCGKVTGLAAYGRYNPDCIRAIENFFEANWKSDGGLNHFDSRHRAPERVEEDLVMIGRTEFAAYSREDMAYAIQHISERKIIDLIRENISDIANSNICLAGGVFANVKINQKIKELGFKNIFVQPAMDDGGLGLGAAYGVLKHHGGLKTRRIDNVFWGPSYEDAEILEAIEKRHLRCERHENINAAVGQILADGKLVARFAGRMEFGPRALGNRSILYQTTDKTVNTWLNRHLERTEFMPFAPAVAAENAQKCFPEIEGSEFAAEFMTITADCSPYMAETSPAVVHVDNTARPQLVTPSGNEGFYEVLTEYTRKTGAPSLINTSFNMHEAPIVRDPDDAIETFLRGKLECLAVGNYLLRQQDTE